MSVDSDVEELLLLYVLSRTERKRIWVHERNKKRKECGEYYRLCRELNSNEDSFFNHFRMSQDSFEELYELLKPKIRKRCTNWRMPISTRERLVICLRYLATGDSYQTISSSFRVGCSTISTIIGKVCKAIWYTLQPIYMPVPNAIIWQQSEMGYNDIWNFPNCIGSIDGKRVVIKTAKASKVIKQTNTLTVLTVIDPYYKFTAVDVDNSLENTDFFETSFFYKELSNTGLHRLPNKPLPGTEEPMPHVLLGDEVFILNTYLMRPYPKPVTLKDEKKANYNKRLYRARAVVDHAYRLLAQNWRILLRPIECDLDKATDVIRATCCLHNYTQVRREPIKPLVFQEKQCIRALTECRPTNKRSVNIAHKIRDKFASYFA